MNIRMMVWYFMFCIVASEENRSARSTEIHINVTTSPMPTVLCLNNCSSHGICIQNKNSSLIPACNCERGWTEKDCSYQQKSQMTAFLLSIFVGNL